MKDFDVYFRVLKNSFKKQLENYVNDHKITFEKLFNEKLKGFIDYRGVSQNFIFPTLALTLGKTPKLIPFSCEQPGSISSNNKLNFFSEDYNKNSNQRNWLCFNSYVQSFDGNFDIKVISQQSLLSIFKVDAPFAVFVDVIQERHKTEYYEYHKLEMPHYNDVKTILVPADGYTLEEFLSNYFKDEIVRNAASVYANEYLIEKLNQIKLEI